MPVRTAHEKLPDENVFLQKTISENPGAKLFVLHQVLHFRFNYKEFSAALLNEGRWSMFLLVAFSCCNMLMVKEIFGTGQRPMAA